MPSTNKEISTYIKQQKINDTSTYIIKDVGKYIFNKDLSNKDVYEIKYLLNDSKLTRKQKIWYAENLSEFIEPKLLRRNYIIKNKKQKRRKK